MTNVGSHIHTLIENHPSDGFPIPRQPYTFRVTVKAHDNPGIINKFTLSDFATNKKTIPLSLGACDDCSVSFDFVVDFSTWSAGRHELRWTAHEKDQDLLMAGDQSQFTTSRSQICLESNLPNRSGRPTPYQGAGGWYKGHGYATALLLSPETSLRPGGEVIVRAWQDANRVCAYLNPDFHAHNSGVNLGCWNGRKNHTVVIPTTANVGDKLVIVADDGFNAGVLRVFIGDGTPRLVMNYEYQSWWAKEGFVLE